MVFELTFSLTNLALSLESGLLTALYMIPDLILVNVSLPHFVYHIKMTGVL